MYYPIFKKVGKNKYYYLGISDKLLDANNYDEFSKRNDNSEYVYFELTEEDMQMLDLKINSYYVDDNGLTLYTSRKPITIDYSNENIFKIIKKMKEEYNIDDKYLYPIEKIYIRDYRNINYKEDKTYRDNNTKLLWYAGSTGVGKTYLLKTIKELFDRPSVIIDCSTLKEDDYRLVVQEILDKILHYFDGNIDDINNAIIMLDNIDKVKVKDCQLEDFLALIQRNFISDISINYYSKDYGEGKLLINNAIVIFTSTLKKSFYKSIDDCNYFLKELKSYKEINFDREDCYKYLDSNLSYLKNISIFYKVNYNVNLVFTKVFIDELVSKVINLNHGYKGFKIIIDGLLKTINVDNYSVITFYDNNKIIYDNKKYKVLSSVR